MVLTLHPAGISATDGLGSSSSPIVLLQLDATTVPFPILFGSFRHFWTIFGPFLDHVLTIQTDNFSCGSQVILVLRRRQGRQVSEPELEAVLDVAVLVDSC